MAKWNKRNLFLLLSYSENTNSIALRFYIYKLCSSEFYVRSRVHDGVVSRIIHTVIVKREIKFSQTSKNSAAKIIK